MKTVTIELPDEFADVITISAIGTTIISSIGRNQISENVTCATFDLKKGTKLKYTNKGWSQGVN